MRAALGASKYRLSRQLLSESVLVALLGGGAAVLLAVQSIDVLNRLHPPGLPPVCACPFGLSGLRIHCRDSDIDRYSVGFGASNCGLPGRRERHVKGRCSNAHGISWPAAGS